MKTNSQQSFLFRFKIQFKAVSTTYTVQVVSNDSLHVPIKRNHNCSSNQHPCYLMHLRNQISVPKQANTVHSHSVVNQQSQHQVPLCLQCHDGSYFSLSLSTPVPILPGKQQCFRLQSQGHQSVQTSCTLLNLRCSTIHALHMATKPRSLTKQTRPSVVLMPTLLKSVATKPGHRPFRVLMPIFLTSVATKPRSPTFPGSHANLSQLCGN